jgi:hypothetical protein
MKTNIVLAAEIAKQFHLLSALLFAQAIRCGNKLGSHFS